MAPLRRGPLGPVSYAGTMAEIRIGTCSWADDALAKHWYPQGVKAGEIAAAIAAVSGGKGGGRPHFASAGAGDPARLGEARAQAPAIVKRLLAR